MILKPSQDFEVDAAIDIDLTKYIARANKYNNSVPKQSRGIKEDMKAYELIGERSKNLQHFYDALQTICPCSVLSEREFSKAVHFLAPRRSRMGDDILCDLSFLKDYYEKQY